MSERYHHHLERTLITPQSASKWFFNILNLSSTSFPSDANELAIILGEEAALNLKNCDPDTEEVYTLHYGEQLYPVVSAMGLLTAYDYSC